MADRGNDVPVKRTGNHSVVFSIFLVLVLCFGVGGGVSREEQCTTCAGSNSTCHLISGLFTRRALRYGYNKIATVPAGACSINVTEMFATRNYIAVRLTEGAYIFNGNWKTVKSGSFDGADSTFQYHRTPQDHAVGMEHVFAKGPTDAAIDIMLLKQSTNLGITYEYIIPMKQNDEGEMQIEVAPGPTGSTNSASDSMKRDESIQKETPPKFSSSSNSSSLSTPSSSVQSDQADIIPLQPLPSNTASRYAYQRGSDIESQSRYRNTDRTSSDPRYHPISDSRSQRVQNSYVDGYNPSSQGQSAVYNQNTGHRLRHRGRHGRSHGAVSPRYIPAQPQTQPQSHTQIQPQSQPQSRLYQGNSLYPAHTQQPYPGRPDIVPMVPINIGGQPSSHSTIQSTYQNNPSLTNSNQPYETAGYQPYSHGSRPYSYNRQNNYNRNNKTPLRSSGYSSSRRGQLNDQVSRNSLQPSYSRKSNDINSGGGDYSWRISGFTECTRTCGGGVQSTIVVCVKGGSQAVVTDENCEEHLKPKLQTVTCNNNPCPASWDAEPWGNCSTSCDRGTAVRVVTCKQRISEIITLSLPDTSCRQRKPTTIKSCNQDLPCVRWKIGDWGQCSTSCGKGQRTREVVCLNHYNNTVPENKCPGARPLHQEICDMGSCARTWFHTTWSDQCSSSCGEGVYTRRTFCSSEPEHCARMNPPAQSKVCMNELPCGGQWFAGPWKKCSASCGAGVIARPVVCMKELGQQMFVVSDDNCLAGEKPVDEQPCQGPPCPQAQWYMTDWAECSVTCAGGVRQREVKCLDVHQDTSIVCDPIDKPPVRRSCNTQACPTGDTGASCVDKFKNCRLVAQARLCEYSYYKSSCCQSCTH